MGLNKELDLVKLVDNVNNGNVTNFLFGFDRVLWLKLCVLSVDNILTTIYLL